MNKKPTISDVKHLSIKNYLSKLGMQPVCIKHNKAWYRSSIGRNGIEKTASLEVDLSNNRFTDYGSGANGDIVDLVCAMHGVDIATAIRTLANDNISLFKGNYSKTTKTASIKILSKHNIRHRALIDYLSLRGIPLSIALWYCSEIHYTNTASGRNFFAIGFPNDKGGWELRNSICKNGTSPKTITTIEGTGTSVNIFEGFTDFLSCLTHYNTQRLKNTTIVLNSTVNYRFIDGMLNEYDCINLFLDNDQTGQELAQQIENTYSNVKNHALSLFNGYKDFNDFLLKKPL